MSKTNNKTQDVASHYDADAHMYHEQYITENVTDSSKPYPANYFRLQLLLNSFINNDVKSVVEVGVGEGTPIAALARAGIDVAGFDISAKMVEKSKEQMVKNDLDPNKIFLGDIQDPVTFSPSLKNGQFDALIAMGVMPHVENDKMVLKNMNTMVKPGGRVFIEFRNKVFSMFTFNRFTYDFIMDDLLQDVAPELKDIVSKNIKGRLEMDKPTHRDVHAEDQSVIGYDAMLSKFHNPFEAQELFEQCGYELENILWYHYHPTMPYLQKENHDLFHQEAIKMEHTDDWRGFFLCSAYVVEAIKL